MKKNLKHMFLISASLAGFGCLLTFPTINNTMQKNKSQWYANLKGDKFEIRDQKSFNVFNSNNEITPVPLNNDFELKILLNPGFQTEYEEFINQFNTNFITKIINEKLKYKSVTYSRMMPIVWFYFENEKNRQEFVKKISNWEEIFKFIIFKNEDATVNSYTYNETQPNTFYSYQNQYSFTFNDVQKNINIFKNYMDENLKVVNAQNHLTNKYVNNVGVIESNAYPIDRNFIKYFKNGIYIDETYMNFALDNTTHATLVTSILGGELGVDKSSKIFLASTFRFDSNWIRTIEKMVKDYGIRIINHSYSMKYLEKEDNIHEYNKGYDENSYHLDYISRKYGVINVFSTGNDARYSQHIINSGNLSLNSIAVGALEKDTTKYNLKSSKIANYSNYKLPSGFDQIAKPLVVAPGYTYNPVYEKNQTVSGTSYAAPIVTGLISNLMKYKSDIRNSSFRVPIVKAILSASAVSPQKLNLKYKTSGYEQKFGSGTPDFQAMLQAANNYSVISSNPSVAKRDIFTSQQIQLQKGQKIKISSSWTFNAGILNQKEPRPWAKNWWNSFWSWFSPAWSSTEQKWDSEHKNENQLSLVGVKNRTYNNLVTNYDLRLEKLANDGSWHIVREITEQMTSDELIEYKVLNSGIYRYKIIKNHYYPDANSIDDLIAVTHVVRNEND